MNINSALEYFLIENLFRRTFLTTQSK